MPKQSKIRVIARNSSKAAYFRETLNRVPGIWPVPILVNFGSMKPHPTFRGIIINPHHSVMRSSDKYAAKENWEIFGEAGLPRHALPYGLVGEFKDSTGTWDMRALRQKYDNMKLIVKPRRSSGGRGIKVLDSCTGLLGLRQKDHYMVERYMEFNREYRIFVAPKLAGIEMIYRLNIHGQTERHEYTRSNGSFFEIRKRLKAGFSLQTRNIAENPEAVYFSRDFQRPSCWELMVYNAVKAAEIVGLDLAAVDIVYNTQTRDFVICEVNSNPGIDLTRNGGRPLSAQALETALIKIITLKCAELRQQSGL